MQKVFAVMRLLVALILAVAAIAAATNLIFISMRPETISVVNAMIGLGILTVCLSALATVLFRSGWKQFRESAETPPDPDSTDDSTHPPHN